MAVQRPPARVCTAVLLFSHIHLAGSSSFAAPFLVRNPVAGGSDTPCHIQRHIASGDLHEARLVATAHGRTASREAAAECAKLWRSSVDHELLTPQRYLVLVAQSHTRRFETRGPVRECFAQAEPHGDSDGIGWTECCSREHGDQGNAHCFGADQLNLGEYLSCCSFGVGSVAYRAIPALMETLVHVKLLDGKHLSLEQDGRLRPFDVGTVLWPAGYLLAQWLSSPAVCGRLAGTKVLELGVGIGAASITAAGCGATVIATDNSWQSLATATANAVMNGEKLETMKVITCLEVQLV